MSSGSTAVAVPAATTATTSNDSTPGPKVKTGKTAKTSKTHPAKKQKLNQDVRATHPALGVQDPNSDPANTGLPTPDPTPDTMSEARVPVPTEPDPSTLVPQDQSLPSFATPQATKFLQKQLRQIIKTQTSTTLGNERYWTLDLSKLDNLYIWYFTLSSFDPEIQLSKDMKKYKVKGVELQVLFGPQHPTTPPFVRIIKPRFMQWINGGGGHISAYLQYACG